ncbi:MAG: cation-translocating P-type ATPase [Candidatus Poribacteria bacterium]|nr:cation-translocating P-type ATPase [Candidatus Poribacteria bacterium]MDE0505792.1 cation-translocating P-type ATPase [Candidatus Poribacteria bacterium]
MAEKTLKLEIYSLLSGIKDEKDGCVKRLMSALRNRPGINEAHLEQNGNVRLCLHYQSELLSTTEVKHVAERVGIEVSERFRHDLIPVKGMHCADCVTSIQHRISQMTGVLSVDVRFVSKNVWVEYDSHFVKREQIEKQVIQLGYRVPAEDIRSWYIENRDLITSILCGICLVIGWSGENLFEFPFPLDTVHHVSAVSLFFFFAAYVFGGLDLFRRTINELKQHHVGIELLMVVASIGAAFLGEFSEGALLLFLFGVGHALEERALDKARKAIISLAELAPKTALVKDAGGESEQAVDDLKLGTIIIVKPGMRIPADGVVVAGKSTANESAVTGESVPVDKEQGSPVFAGGINGDGSLEVRVTRLSDDTMLARVVSMVEEAQTQKSNSQRITDKFSGVFVPLILIGAISMILMLVSFGIPFSESFLRGMVLLVAASPCALALGPPSAILAGIARAARNGVLIKGGIHLENLGKAKAVAFDKTGTLTKGKPEVTDVISIGEMDVDYWLKMAAAAENRSGHPIAEAVVDVAVKRGFRLPEVEEVESLIGRGIRAQVSGKTVWVGNLKLYNEAHLEIRTSVQAQVAKLEEEGKSIMLVTIDQKPVGIIGVIDAMRAELGTVVAELKQIGIGHTVVLTGDNPRVASYIAQRAGIKEYKAGLLPQDKVMIMHQLLNSYDSVVMVGDGINDAPALASATTGIAMGGAGSDLALETADAALMADDLSKLPFAIGLGRATRKVISQNLYIALAVIGGLIGSTIFGLATIGIAIILHEGSTILVVLNSLRLLRFRHLPNN